MLLWGGGTWSEACGYGRGDYDGGEPQVLHLPPPEAPERARQLQGRVLSQLLRWKNASSPSL